MTNSRERRRQKIRIEAEPEKLLAFITARNYPYTWHLETFQTYCIALRVEEGNPPETVAYVWATWEAPGVLDVHACTSRRLWLSREILDRLYVLAELFGARAVQTTARSATIRRLLHNIGWEREGEVFKKKLDEPLELPLPKDPDAAAGADAPAPADTGNGDDAGRC